MKKLFKISDQTKIAGVCAGLSDYFQIDVTVIRLIFAICAIPTFGTTLLVYAIMAIVLPEKDSFIY